MLGSGGCLLHLLRSRLGEHDLLWGARTKR